MRLRRPLPRRGGGLSAAVPRAWPSGHQLVRIGTMQPFHRLDRALVLLRGRAGLTQAETARRAEVTPAMLSEYESGKKRPHVDTLEKILVVLDSDLHDLANCLRAAWREEVAAPRLTTEALTQPRGRLEEPDQARQRAARALGELTTSFDSLTRALEDLLVIDRGRG